MDTVPPSSAAAGGQARTCDYCPPSRPTLAVTVNEDGTPLCATCARRDAAARDLERARQAAWTGIFIAPRREQERKDAALRQELDELRRLALAQPAAQQPEPDGPAATTQRARRGPTPRRQRPEWVEKMQALLCAAYRAACDAEANADQPGQVAVAQQLNARGYVINTKDNGRALQRLLTDVGWTWPPPCAAHDE